MGVGSSFTLCKWLMLCRKWRATQESTWILLIHALCSKVYQLCMRSPVFNGKHAICRTGNIPARPGIEYFHHEPVVLVRLMRVTEQHNTCSGPVAQKIVLLLHHVVKWDTEVTSNGIRRSSDCSRRMNSRGSSPLRGQNVRTTFNRGSQYLSQSPVPQGHAI